MWYVCIDINLILYNSWSAYNNLAQVEDDIKTWSYKEAFSALKNNRVFLSTSTQTIGLLTKHIYPEFQSFKKMLSPLLSYTHPIKS